ncbi:MAG TPA: helix-turn-helix domain-containing protein [Verrucomicrobiae bacterium]|jgi:DNA-binding NtrC family response regulator|nr:helix-turn-helix domain-containing protein [Verrucomicrobiae bacterium]
MSTLEAVPMWISVPDPAAPSAPVVEAPKQAPAPMRVGVFSLRQIVDSAVTRAEGEAIRWALVSTLGNKSHAARLLRTNYTTLHAKMKRYGISAREFQRPA